MAQNRDDGFGRYRDDDGRPWEDEPTGTDDSDDDDDKGQQQQSNDNDPCGNTFLPPDLRKYILITGPTELQPYYTNQTTYCSPGLSFVRNWI